ncbi:AEC family transporter [Acinetobacter pragensis]|uniref:Transporter n=1 Tax=Acinetobacter pragensis TaxID=1806892 RepID=A0A151Y6K8_9GAMM|nr:AEC family transporter [Acinetobacter pragensis]KYQ73587.1 transporter [Acinetobacter pragensis]
MLASVLLPICLIVLLGYWAIRNGFIEAGHLQALSQFVMKVSLPAFLVQALASKNLAEIWHPGYFIGYGGGSLLLFLLTLLLCRKVFNEPLTRASVLAMGASMSNTGFIGTAILTLLLGSHSAVYLSLTLIIENLLILSLMLLLAERGQHLNLPQQGAVFKILLKRLMQNPVILAILIGISCVLMQLKLPEFLVQVLEMLGKTASPLALFVIGGSLVGMKLSTVNVQSAVLVGLKVIVMPLLIFSLLWLMDVSREMMFVGTLLAALPMPIAFGIFAQHYGLGEKALAPLVLSTIAGFIAVAILLSQSSQFIAL